MDNSDFFYKVKKELLEGRSFFIMCDGYEDWNYGFPVNPICFNNDEYKFVLCFLKEKFNYDLEDHIIKHSGWDCIFSEQIINFLGKRVCTFTKFPSFIKINTDIPTQKDWEKFLFKSENERIKSLSEKELFFMKIKDN